MDSVVITGVSTGIGFDTALRLGQRGFHVFGSVRREEDGRKLSDRMGDTFTPLLFDVTDGQAVADAAALVKEAIGRPNQDGSPNLAGLINNAGFSVSGPLMHMPIEELEKQFDVNVFGVQRVTQAFLPLLGADRERKGRPGRIINVSSVSGKITMPFLGAYAASKHALESLSDAYRRELALYGIEVVVIEPGVIDTPIWDKGETVSPYADTDYGPSHKRFLDSLTDLGRSGLPAARVSDLICTALLSRSPKTRYAILPGGLKARIKKWWLPRFLPDRWLDRVVKGMWGH